MDTKPWRIICLNPEELRIRLDPSGAWKQNWRNYLLEKLEALATFERQTRTLSDKKIDIGDRLIRRVIDGWAGVEEGDAPDWDSGIGLTKLLKQARAFPVNAFFIEVSLDFMERLITWAVDASGVVHWGIHAGKAAQQATLAKPEPNPKEANRIRKELEQKARKQPYYQHSPRLLTYGNLKKWPISRKCLAYTLLQEAYPSSSEDDPYTPCNGHRGYGYKIKTWMIKANSLQPQGHKKLSQHQQYQSFLEDLGELCRALNLKIELKGSPQLDSETVLTHLDLIKEQLPIVLGLLLKIYIPRNYEEILAAKLEEIGIEEEIKQEELKPKEELTPLNLIKARKRAKWTQADLAQKLGVSQSMVAYWESQKKLIPKEKQTQIKEFLAQYLTE